METERTHRHLVNLGVVDLIATLYESGKLMGPIITPLLPG